MFIGNNLKTYYKSLWNYKNVLDYIVKPNLPIFLFYQLSLSHKYIKTIAAI